MSYTEYLRRKADASPKIIDYQPKKVDASQFITQKRLAASTVFYLSSKRGAITQSFDDNYAMPNGSKMPVKTVKTTGAVPDASDFIAYIGGNAVDEKLAEGSRTTKYVLPANLPTTLCNDSFINGPAAPKSAGDWTRSQAPCVNGREPHVQSELGPALFVDNTNTIKNYNLPQNMTTYQISQDCLQCGNNKTVGGKTCAFCIGANHTHPADVPHNTEWIPRPKHGMGGIPVSTVPSPSDARKVGNYDYKDRQKYVEKHHGNDLNVNPRLVPGKFVPTNGAPAQLKINDPRHYPVA